MKWIKRKLRNWIDDECNTLNVQPMYCRDEPDTECIRFKVFRANGGVVVQTDTHDRKTDRLHNSLHVIVEGQDLGTELGKIITFESLKL